MEDRTPTPGQEGRVLITPENGSAPFYAKVTMADNPTNPGTPLNKETLLQDSTEIEIFGNASNRTVAEAFSGIMNRIELIMQNVASMALTITDTAGNPIPGVYVKGVFDDNGNPIKTNASGQINGYVSEGDTTLSIQDYADIIPYSEVFTAVKGQSYTKTIQVTTRNFLKILSSGQYRLSGNVEQVDVTAVGGGGGGAGGSANTDLESPGSGGGGGYCTVQENVSFVPGVSYPAIVGAGGVRGAGASDNTLTATAGGNGGQSSFLGVSANGGMGGNLGDGAQGGSGNGKGGNAPSSFNTSGVDGVAGSVLGYSSFTETVRYGGGGGSGAYGESRELTPGEGGEGYGGDGGRYSPGSAIGCTPGADGFGGGGGGGYAGDYSAGYGPAENGEKGGSGCLALRMHLATAA